MNILRILGLILLAVLIFSLVGAVLVLFTFAGYYLFGVFGAIAGFVLWLLVSIIFYWLL